MKFLLFPILILLSTSLNSQIKRTCGFKGDSRHLLQNRSLLEETDDVLYVPIVVHIFHRGDESEISREQVLSQIRVLNKDFNRLNEDQGNTPKKYQYEAGNGNIKFFLARRDPNGNCHPGINYINSSLADHDFNETRKLTARSMWNTSEYLNIYVVKSIDGNGEDILGYTEGPGLDSLTDVVVIKHENFGTNGSVKAPFHLGRTTTHEVAHWMGLLHIWGGISAIGSYCDSDDGFEDTPNQQTANYGNPETDKNSCNNDGDMYMNYMDYTNDSIMNLFTNDQVEYMRMILQTDARRKHMISEENTALEYFYDNTLLSRSNNYCDTSLQTFSIPHNAHLNTNWKIIHETDTLYKSSANSISFRFNSTSKITIQLILSDSCIKDTIQQTIQPFGCSLSLPHIAKFEKDISIQNNTLFNKGNATWDCSIYTISGSLYFKGILTDKILLPQSNGLYIISLTNSKETINFKYHR